MAENYSREALLKAIAIDGGIYLLFLTFVLLGNQTLSVASSISLILPLQYSNGRTKFSFYVLPNTCNAETVYRDIIRNSKWD